MASILTTIDQIIERANAVKVCQDHTKLITTSLTRLQHRLTILDETPLQGDLVEILETINEIVTTCAENENLLKGITYKDLESALFRLQYRLAQYQCNFADDCETRVEILSNALEEQRHCLTKSSDETWKQRLDTLEQQTKINITEKHCYLREKYSQTIESYLRTCIELHQWVSIPGLTSDVVITVAKIFYQISSEEQTILENKWQSFKLPIKQRFLQFKVDRLIQFEKKKLRRLLTEDENDINEERFIGNKRWSIILGEPGSGKTNFVQWIVYYFAQTLLKREYSTKYGPVRIPILISIDEFIEVWKENPSLTLFDYIGKQKWMGSSIPLDDLSCALQDYIKQGQALIILDGLEQISTLDQRSKRIDIIENFVDTYVQTPLEEYSLFDNVFLSILLDDPSRSGGNQLIVTSRIGSYHTVGLTDKFSCYTIQPIEKKSIRDFIDYYYFHVQKSLMEMLNISLPSQSINLTEKLKRELETTQNIDLLEMCSNPRLLSYICTLDFSQTFPNQRFLQYESLIKTMLTLWSKKKSSIDISQVIKILTEITSYIYQNSTSNIISHDQIKEICLQTIKPSTKNFERQVSEMLYIICDNLGILTLREESTYGFIHLAFEQYFTCLRFLESDKSSGKQKFVVDGFNEEKKIEVVNQILCRHISDKRFRVPTALALGKLSSSWSQGSFDDLCYEFIQTQHQYDSFLPFNCYILINSIDDFVNYPSNEILFNVLDRLIISAGQHKWSILCPFLFDQITNLLNKLGKDIVSLWINQFLTQYSSDNIQTLTAFCQLLEGKAHQFENIQWLDQRSCLKLQSLSIFDNEKNGFAIDRLLVQISFSNYQLFSSNPTTLRHFLIENNISIPVVILPLIISLYGGLERNGQNVLFNPYHIHRESSVLTPILIRFLSSNDEDKQEQNLKKFQEECLKSFLMRIAKDDESSEAIDLCIATICLYDIQYIQTNLDIISNSFLRICMNRLKYISMILRQFYFTYDEDDLTIENETTKYLSIIIDKFQSLQPRRFQFLSLINTLRSSVARLRSSSTSILIKGLSEADKRLTLYLPNSLRNEEKFLNSLLITDIQFHSNDKSCSFIHYFSKLFWLFEHNDQLNTSYRMSNALNTIPQYLIFRNDEDILTSLTFLPTHLQNLYIRLLKENLILINEKDSIINNEHYLYFGHILTECLMFLSNASCKRLSRLGGLIHLLPWLRMQYLDNFGSSLFWTLALDDSLLLDIYERKRKRPTNYQTGKYLDDDTEFFKGLNLKDDQRKTIIENDIEQELRRIENASIDNDQKDLKLYSSSISLSHLSHWTDDQTKLDLLEKCLKGAMSIENKLVRLDALCLIALFQYSDYDQIEVDNNRSLKMEIEYQFNEIYSNLPPLLETAIFIRCLPLLNSQSIDDCLENLIRKLNGIDQRDRQSIIEALSPYMELNDTFSFLPNRFLHSFKDQNLNLYSKSSNLKKYFDISRNENLSFSLTISNLYLIELANDFHTLFQSDNRQFNIDQSIETKLFQLGNNILKFEQVLTINSIISFVLLTNEYEKYEKLLIILNNGLHRMIWVEFKACHLLQTWLKWSDSNQLSYLAYHAALILINSDFWSVEGTKLVCDLLCSDNDRFRQRAEMICRSSVEHDVKTSSKLGKDVLLVLVKKKIDYQLNSSSVGLTLNRLLRNLTLDIQSHLETLLWLERYRIHALINLEYSFKNFRSFFSPDLDLDSCSYINSFRLSDDLVLYFCHLIESNFSKFVSIDGDSTSNEVLESHNRFVVSLLLTLYKLLNNNNQTRERGMIALIKLFDKSNNNEICESISCLLGYISNEKTYKKLFQKIVWILNKFCYGTSHYSIDILCRLISSYFYCISINKIKFDQDDLDLFSTLLKHQSQEIVKVVRIGLSRVIKDPLSLIQFLNCDYIQCYHALIGSTSSWYVDQIQQENENNAAKFIEEHSTLLPIFMLELSNSISHFSCKIQQIGFNNSDLAFGYPTYVKIASLIAVRIPNVFCAFVNNWVNRDNFKRMLFYTSKQNHCSQRAACLTILSVLGELTIELCEIFVEAVRDDPFIQNNSYQSIKRLRSIKDEKVVLNLLLSYLKSKSMSVRYIAAKILLHLTQSSIIPFEQVQTILNDLMLDSTSNEDLWLIKEQDGFSFECQYYNVGPLKDVIYSLVVQHITQQKSDNIRKTELNDIHLDFIESEKASRSASCIYEKKSEDIPE